MAEVKGTVRYLDLEGGLWVLDSDDGTRYQLEGGKTRLFKHGHRVVIVGEIADDAFSIGMVGPSLLVRGYRKV